MTPSVVLYIWLTDCLALPWAFHLMRSCFRINQTTCFSKCLVVYDFLIFGRLTLQNCSIDKLYAHSWDILRVIKGIAVRLPMDESMSFDMLRSMNMNFPLQLSAVNLQALYLRLHKPVLNFLWSNQTLQVLYLLLIFQ